MAEEAIIPTCSSPEAVNPEVERQTLNCQVSINLLMPPQYPVRPRGTDISHLRHCFYDGFPVDEATAPLVYKGSLVCSLSCGLAFFKMVDRPRFLFEFAPDTPFDEVPRVAPPRERLDAYGGTMTLAEFRTGVPVPVEVCDPSKLRCCYDCHVLEGPPVICEGTVYCSLKCRLASIIENTCVGSVVESKFRSENLGLIPAPPRILLATFGGVMSITEFRAASNFYVIHPPRSLAPNGTISEENLPTYSTREPNEPSQPIPVRIVPITPPTVSASSKTRPLRNIRIQRTPDIVHVSTNNILKGGTRGSVHLPFAKRIVPK